MIHFQLDAMHPAGATLNSQLASGIDPMEALRKAVEVFTMLFITRLNLSLVSSHVIADSLVRIGQNI